MVMKHLKIWAALMVFANGVVIVGSRDALPEPLDLILSPLAVVLLMACGGAYLWEERRERQAHRSVGETISPSDQT